jgi:hypothetical protein
MRLRVDVWEHPFQEGVAVFREAWIGGSTDDGYWPTDSCLAPEQAARELAVLKTRARTEVHDHRPEVFPFKRIEGR